MDENKHLYLNTDTIVRQKVIVVFLRSGKFLFYATEVDSFLLFSNVS